MARVATFGYGSNSVRQLRGRLEDPVLCGYPGKIRNLALAFGGPNHTWAHDAGGEAGGTATLVPVEGEVALGTVCYLTKEQLDILDGFEGVPYAYQRKEFTAEILQGGAWTEAPVVAYIKQKHDWYPPSEAYRCAVLRNLRGSFPALSALTLRSCDGQAKGTWAHPGFSQLGLGAFLFEVGIRQREPWTMPVQIGRALRDLVGAGVSGNRGEALLAVADAGKLPLGAEELALARSLLALEGAGPTLQDGLGDDDAQAERAPAE